MKKRYVLFVMLSVTKSISIRLLGIVHSMYMQRGVSCLSLCWCCIFNAIKTVCYEMEFKSLNERWRIWKHQNKHFFPIVFTFSLVASIQYDYCRAKKKMPCFWVYNCALCSILFHKARNHKKKYPFNLWYCSIPLYLMIITIMAFRFRVRFSFTQ